MFELPIPDDDGLLIPAVKPWSKDKHHFLRRYIDAFTNAMTDKWDLHYIDLFAGAGIERVEGKGLDWGSPLIAAQAPKKFAQLHLGEYAKRKFETLKSRLSRYVQPTPPQLLRGDANRVVTQVVRTIPPTDTLSLGFLDPYGLHLHFTTVQKLSERSTDLIIFFPDHIDVLRNWQAYYADDPESNLDRVLGTSAWRDRKAATPPDRWIEVLRELYEGQLRTLGYAEFRYERIRNSEGRPLYRLIFCSRHKMGGDLWTRTSSKKPDEQRHFEW